MIPDKLLVEHIDKIEVVSNLLEPPRRIGFAAACMTRARSAYVRAISARGPEMKSLATFDTLLDCLWAAARSDNISLLAAAKSLVSKLPVEDITLAPADGAAALVF